MNDRKEGNIQYLSIIEQSKKSNRVPVPSTLYVCVYKVYIDSGNISVDSLTLFCRVRVSRPDIWGIANDMMTTSNLA